MLTRAFNSTTTLSFTIKSALLVSTSASDISCDFLAYGSILKRVNEEKIFINMATNLLFE